MYIGTNKPLSQGSFYSIPEINALLDDLKDDIKPVMLTLESDLSGSVINPYTCKELYELYISGKRCIIVNSSNGYGDGREIIYADYGDGSYTFVIYFSGRLTNFTGSENENPYNDGK